VEAAGTPSGVAVAVKDGLGVSTGAGVAGPGVVGTDALSFAGVAAAPKLNPLPPVSGPEAFLRVLASVEVPEKLNAGGGAGAAASFSSSPSAGAGADKPPNEKFVAGAVALASPPVGAAAGVPDVPPNPPAKLKVVDGADAFLSFPPEAGAADGVPPNANEGGCAAGAALAGAGVTPEPKAKLDTGRFAAASLLSPVGAGADAGVAPPPKEKDGVPPIAGF
jgi:hypothetical protein